MKAVIDFETHDPYLVFPDPDSPNPKAPRQLTLGPGWVHGQYELVCMGAQDHIGKQYFFTNKTDMKSFLENCDTLIAQNGMYDFGFVEDLGVDLSDKTLIDTIHLAVMNNNVEDAPAKPYSLANLSKKYLPKQKDSKSLGLVAIERGLVKTKGRSSTTISSAATYAIKNMHLMINIAPEVVEHYCLRDVETTYMLYDLFKGQATDEWIEILSNVTKLLLQMQRRGIRVDLDKIEETRKELMAEEIRIYREIEGMLQLSAPLDLDGRLSLISYLDQLNIPYPKTAKGNPSIDKYFLEKVTHPFGKLLKEYRHYKTLRSTFCDGVIKTQQHLPLEKRGRVYPQIKLMGANATHRFSSSGPNIQNIPSADKDPKFGRLIRECYLAEEGHFLFAPDFNQEEYRVFAHGLARYLGDTSLSSKYHADPKTDIHADVGEMINIGTTPKERRSIGKANNFASLYGQGIAARAQALNVSEDEAKRIRDAYYENVPGIKRFEEYLKQCYRKKGYILIDGLKLRVEPSKWVKGKHKEYLYRLLNYYCQCLSAHIMIKCLNWCYLNGILPLFTVHDELGLSLPNTKQGFMRAEETRQAMENIVELKVPLVVDMNRGLNWAEAKEKHE